MKPVYFLLVPTLLISGLFASCNKGNNSTGAITVDAGQFQYTQLPKDTANLTGVISSGQSIASVYSWSLVTGPNIPVFNHSDALNTQVTNLIAGTYIFQFEATSSNGTIIGIDTTGVIVVPGSQTILTLQPNLNPTETFAYSYSPTTALGPNLAYLPITAWTVGGGVTQTATKIFIQYDLSSIPANATIISAKYSLFSLTSAEWHGGGGGNVDAPQFTNGYDGCYIKRVTSAWSASTLDWNNMPTDTVQNEVIIPESTDTVGNETDLNVTSLIQDMKTNGNHGFEIGLINSVPYSQREFGSSLATNPAERPKLVIVYQ